MSAPEEDRAFPVLSTAQVAEVASFGVERPVAAGELLFEAGEASYQLFVVLDGEVEIVRLDAADAAPIASYGPGGFAGELNLLTGPPRPGRPAHCRPRPGRRCSRVWPGMSARDARRTSPGRAGVESPSRCDALLKGMGLDQAGASSRIENYAVSRMASRAGTSRQEPLYRRCALGLVSTHRATSRACGI
jgi:hypothetical protein